MKRTEDHDQFWGVPEDGEIGDLRMRLVGWLAGVVIALLIGAIYLVIWGSPL